MKRQCGMGLSKQINAKIFMRSFLLTLISLFLIVNVLFGQKGNTENISKPIKNIIDKLSNGRGYFTGGIGYDGEIPKEYKRYLALEKASVQELVSLTNNSNGLIRSYASLALSKIMSCNEYYELVLSHLTDTTEIYTMQGCIGFTIRVGDIFIENFNSQCNTNSLSNNLDSIIFFGNYDLSYANSIRRKGGEKLKSSKNAIESRLVKLAKSGDENSIMALLNDGDIKYLHLTDSLLKISKSLYYRSILNFDRLEYFVPTLDSLATDAIHYTKGHSSAWKYLYENIAKYENNWGFSKLLEPLNYVDRFDIQKYYARHISNAISYSDSELYDTLHYILWRDYKILNPDKINKLFNYYPSKIDACISIFNEFNEIDCPAYEYNSEGKEKILNNYFHDLPKHAALRFLRYQLNNSYIGDFKYIVKYLDNQSINLVITQIRHLLRHEENIYYHHAILEALSNLELDPETKDSITNAFEENSDIKNSWGYPKAKSLIDKLR